MYNAEYVTFSATINVTYTEGATCTCTLGDKVLTAPDTTGFYAFTVGAAGTWTVKIEKEGEDEPKTTTVEITSNGQTEAVEVSFLEIVPWSTGTDEQIAKMMEAHYEGKIDVTDYWAVGDERPVELTTGENVQMVLMHEGQYPLAKVDTLAGNLRAGDVIQLNENGSPVDYLVLHQGLPSDMYDESCNGAWVVRLDILKNQAWDSTDNDYQNSSIYAYLNGEFLNRFDETTKNAIKQVKIPYVNGTGGSPVASGANGLNCKAFLLSGYELGWTASDTTTQLPADGAKLDYFDSGTGTSANNKRIANYNGSAANWWLRSPDTGGGNYVWYVINNGGYGNWTCGDPSGVRPSFILDPTATVKKCPTCAFVVGVKNCLNKKYSMNNDYDSVGGWKACKMRTRLNDTVYNQIPETFRQILKQMNIWTANGWYQAKGVYSQDYLALPAEKEVFGSNRYADSSIESQLFQFEWYKTVANRIKQVNGENDDWWERSVRSDYSGYFCRVNSNGAVSTGSSETSSGVSFFGCI